MKHFMAGPKGTSKPQQICVPLSVKQIICSHVVLALGWEV